MLRSGTVSSGGNTNSIDITSIDDQVKKKFLQEEESLPLYKSRLKDMKLTLTHPTISTRARTKLEKNVIELEKEISDIENEITKNYYILETADLLRRYNVILKIPVRASFVGKPKEDVKSNEKMEEKREITLKYVQIVKKYSPINVDVNKISNEFVCEHCKGIEYTVGENANICVSCGAEHEIINAASSYNDVDRVNISTKYTYDRKVHFKDCINQYQGKQNCAIETKVYTDLEDILYRHHLIINDAADPKEKRFAKITKDHILMFLKELGYSKHYENVTLIHYTLTGKKPDNISHLEDQLLADFDLLIETYDRLFKTKVDRVNFISTQYVLYQLLQKYKHPCRKEDFIILKTVDRKAFHDNIARELFAELGWNFSSPLIS